MLSVQLREGHAQEANNPVREFIEKFSADVKTLDHRYRVPLDEQAVARRLQITEKWLTQLQEVDFDQLGPIGKTDYLLLRSELQYRIKNTALQRKRDKQAAHWLPYRKELVAFCKSREDVEPIEPRAIAATLNRLAALAEDTTSTLSPLAHVGKSDEATSKKLEALRATELINSLIRSAQEAHSFYEGYDPSYSWWVKKPMERLVSALRAHKKALRETIVGVSESDNDTIIGLPIGSDGLKLELEHEWIAHTPEELVTLAKREMAWCEAEMAKASRELGFEDDWRAAMEFVKSKHVDPGEQPKMIRDLAWEAIRFLEANDLVTVPAMAANGWRMTMMSPERQRLNPYFLGGDTIIVSFPTDTMTHDEKLMSMRSNNEHFSRATVHHELIPGHHLQYYMMPRHKPYRSLFRTPFWIEGWALYWEMLLWDLGFAQGPEDRVGMLFWRKHRCARIIFSLSYHLKTMSPEECIEYLVAKVGHEPSAAAAEVRRSIMGGYSPLYQAAYMLGGLQIRQLHKEIVQSGKMTNKEFHDSILHENSIPIEVLRNYMTETEVTRDTIANWRFAADD